MGSESHESLSALSGIPFHSGQFQLSRVNKSRAQVNHVDASRDASGVRQDNEQYLSNRFFKATAIDHLASCDDDGE